MSKIKDFLPLIMLFSLILLFSFVRQLLAPAWDLHEFSYDFMGAFFIIFGGFKLYNLQAFAHAYAEYDLIAQRSSLYAQIYPVIELILGLAYLTRTFLVTTQIVTVLLMLVSAAGVAVALSKQQNFTCACLGVVFKIPMTYVTLFEDLLMAVMALAMLIM